VYGIVICIGIVAWRKKSGKPWGIVSVHGMLLTIYKYDVNKIVASSLRHRLQHRGTSFLDPSASHTLMTDVVSVIL